MRLTEPAGLWLLTLLVPLLLLYILRSRPQPLLVGSLWLWSRAAAELEARHPFRKWLAQFPLVLQALTVIVLSLTVSAPTTRGEELARRVAIIIDLSASMQTRNSSGTARIDEAKQQVADFVAGLHPDTEILLLSAGRAASVVTPFERDRRRVLERLQGLDAGDIEGRLQPALELAGDKLAQAQGDSLLVVVTDGVLAERALPPLPDLRVRVIRVGTGSDNVAITRVDAESERSKTSPELNSTAVFASVRNFSEHRRNVFLTLRQRNVQGVLSSRQLTLEPAEERPTVLHFQATPHDEGSGLIVELSPTDTLEVDDRAYVTVPQLGKQQVVIVSDEPRRWLERALAADPEVVMRRMPIAQFDAQATPADAMVVFCGSCPRAAPSHSFVVVDPPPGRCLTVTVSDRLDRPEITHWDEADPRFRFSSLADLRIASARRLEPESPNETLLWASDRALMTRLDLRDRQGTVIGFSFENSNWPLHASFVLFVRNLVDLARDQRQRATRTSVQTGEPIRVRVPPDVTTASATLPDGATRELRASDGVALLPNAASAGFYYFAWQGNSPGSTLVPANLVSEAESDPTLDQLPDDDESSSTTSRAVTKDRHLSVWLASLALLLLLLDAAYYMGAWTLPRGRRT